MKIVILFALACAVYSQSTQGPDVADPCSDPTTPRPPTVVCPVGYGAGGVSGVIAASSFPSCTAFQGTLDCGDVQNVTVLDLGLNGGTGQSVTYEFSVVPSSGSALNSVIQNDCMASGGCGVNAGGRVQVTVVASPVILFYELVDVSLEVPYTYTSFHSNAFRPFDKHDNPDFCGASTTAPSNSAGDPAIASGGQLMKYIFGSGSPRQADSPGGEDGINWSYTASFIATVDQFPVTTWPSASWVKLLLKHGDSPGVPSGDYCTGTVCVNPVPYVSDEYGSEMAFSKQNYARALCDMPAANDAISSSFMEDVSGKEANGARQALCMYYNTNGFSASFDGDGSYDRSNQDVTCSDQSDNDDCRVPNGHCSAGSQSRPEHCRVEKDDNCDDGDWNNCMKKFQKLRSNQPCRQYYGNHFYLGRADRYHYIFNNYQGYGWKSDDLATYGSVSDIRPVIIGCGAGPATGKPNQVLSPFFPFGLAPVSPIINGNTVDFSNPDPKNYLNFYSPLRKDPTTGMHYEEDEEAQFNACGPDDDFCCEADIFSESQAQTVPMIICTPGIDQTTETSNPDCPSDAEPSHCPLCSPDRSGLYTDDSLYYTASTMGKIGPFNHVFDIQPAANPVFNVTATMVNINSDGSIGSIISTVTITNIVLEDIPNGSSNQKITTPKIQGLVGTQATDPKKIMLLQIVGIDTTTGEVGPDLPGYIVVVNETSTVTGGSRVLYQGDTTQGGLANPWTVTNPFGNQLGGITPWPEFMNLDSKNGTSNVGGAWWYYVPADKKKQYGTGCGKLGIKNDYFADLANAARLCTQDRNTCVPGFIPGFDWTIQDRLNDAINPNIPPSERTAQERSLRDGLPVHSPCVVASYFHEWMSTAESCSDFIQKANTQRYLPPNFVLDTVAGSGRCQMPQYWMYGNRLFYEDKDVNSNTLYIRLRLSVAGQLLNVDQQVSGGCFCKTGAQADQDDLCLSDSEPPTINDVQCAVIQNESSGSITVNVLNTGGITGDYTIQTNCTASSGITSITDPVFELNRNSPARAVTIPIQHSGLFTQNATCSLRLTHPEFLFATFWELNNIPCVIAEQSTGSPVSVNVSAANACKEFGIGCQLLTPEASSDDLIWWWLAAAVTIMVLVITCCFCTMNECQKDSIAESRQKKDVAAQKQALAAYK